MNTILIFGTIEGPVEVKTVGDKQLKLAEYRIDGIPCQSWQESADKVPPIGSQVVASGFVKARQRQANSGATFIDISVSISRFEPAGGAPQPRPVPAPAAPVVDDALFGD